MELQEYNTKGGKLRAIQIEYPVEVATVGNWCRTVIPGEWLIGTNRPDTFNVMTDEEFQNYVVREDDSEEEIETFNPSDHTAQEVREYLTSVQRSNVDEYNRVVNEERNGRNRVSAFPL